MNGTITTLAIADHGPWRDHDGPPEFWPVFPLLWLLVLAAVVATAIVVSRRSRAAQPRCAGETRLAERYAAGEIDEEEYRTRRAVLREKG
jgi:uncharacterized membrane protein